MPIYKLIEYYDNYYKISGGLLQHFFTEPTFTENGVIIDFLDGNDSVSFKFKQI